MLLDVAIVPRGRLPGKVECLVKYAHSQYFIPFAMKICTISLFCFGILHILISFLTYGLLLVCIYICIEDQKTSLPFSSWKSKCRGTQHCDTIFNTNWTQNCDRIINTNWTPIILRRYCTWWNTRILKILSSSNDSSWNRWTISQECSRGHAFRPAKTLRSSSGLGSWTNICECCVFVRGLVRPLHDLKDPTILFALYQLGKIPSDNTSEG